MIIIKVYFDHLGIGKKEVTENQLNTIGFIKNENNPKLFNKTIKNFELQYEKNNLFGDILTCKTQKDSIQSCLDIMFNKNAKFNRIEIFFIDYIIPINNSNWNKINSKLKEHKNIKKCFISKNKNYFIYLDTAAKEVKNILPRIKQTLNI